MKLKVKHFHFYNLVTVCFDYASEILCTRYREPVQYIGSLDLLKVECTGVSGWMVRPPDVPVRNF